MVEIKKLGNGYGAIQTEAIFRAIEDVRLEDNPGIKNEPDTASTLLVVSLGRLPMGNNPDTNGLHHATAAIVKEVEDLTSLKGEAGFGHENGNWAITLAFKPEDKPVLEGKLEAITDKIMRQRGAYLS